MIRYIARCVLPGVGRPWLDGGAVSVSGDRIVAVDQADGSDGAGGRTVDLGDAVLMPGLINAHTHLELAWAARHRPPGGDWVRWVEQLVEARASGDPEDAPAAAVAAVASMRARGTAAVGDVANTGAGLPALIDSRLHGVVFHEVFRARAAEADEALATGKATLRRLRECVRRAEADGRITVGLTAHAPHSTSPALVAAIAREAARDGTRLSIHTAESAAEIRWLRDGGGPWAAFLARRGLDDLGWSPPGLSSAAMLDRAGALREGTVLIHGGGLDAGDVDLVRRRGAAVVTCPRSNAYLGVATAPVPALLAAGARVALGTDSLASCPDVDLFAEMAALRRAHPGIAPDVVVRMATADGARVLGLDDRLGAISVGRIAALVAIPLAAASDDPFETVTSHPTRVEPLGVLAS